MAWCPRDLELTDDQKAAVDHGEGPILVVAGAGTGKTTVLASRAVRLIEDKLADPGAILAVTYTRNSAHDLMKRIARFWMGNDEMASLSRVAESGLKIGTFHAYCYKLLREAGQRFELIDEKDLYVLLRRHQEELKLHYYVKAATPGEFLEGLTNFFKRCHDELRTPDDYDDYVAKLENRQIPLPRVTRGSASQAMPEDEVLGRCREIARIFRYVEDMLTAENLGTYSHVITRAIHLLRNPENSAYLERARQGAGFVLIDEFQDSNIAQIELAHLLAGDKASVFAVGDPDQAIYRFRGATGGAFDRFLRTFGIERVKRVTMSENRRSTDFILRSAYSIISHNPQITSVELPDGKRWEREALRHMRKNEREPVSPVRIKAWETQDSEAAFVAQEISRLHDGEARSWRDFAVLYRSHLHGNALVEELLQRRIPFAVTGLDVLSTPEVRDTLAGLRAVLGGDAVALLRVAALPVFSVDGGELRAALAASENGSALESTLERVPGGADVITVLAEARHRVERFQNKALTACGIVQKYFGIGSTPDTEAFTQFVQGWSHKPRQVSGDGTLSEFLEYLEYFSEIKGRVTAPEESDEETPASLEMEYGQSPGAKQTGDAVQLLTVHAAKGLEFPVVFVLKGTHPWFPSKYREDLVEFPDELRDRDSRPEEAPKEANEQEERRLFYVAMTRAEDRLVLCGKKGIGKKDPTPPGYLRELIVAGAKKIQGCIEFAFVPGTMVAKIHAESPPLPRITEWMKLPALPRTLNRRLSASAIERYERCPLSHKLELEWKLPEEPAANLQYGAAMHSALLAHFDAVRKGRPMSADEVVAYFLCLFEKAKIEDPTQRRLYERDGPQQLRAFLQSPAATPNGRVSMVEHSFQFEVAGTSVIGRIDRVDEDDDGYTIVDYKTGNAKSQKLADESLQLSIYALAMSATKPVKRLVFQNLQDNTPIMTERSPDALHKAEAKIMAAASGIAAGEFEPKPGTHCIWCGYRTICPAQEVRPRPAPAPDVEADTVGQLSLWRGSTYGAKN